ncbi:hypothetical protein Tco_0919642 [Tanacetum coccineum]
MAAYQILRKEWFLIKIIMSLELCLKIFLKNELFRVVQNGDKEVMEQIHPEEMYDRVLWGDLKTMFDPPLSDDAIWSLPLQQKIINWRTSKDHQFKEAKDLKDMLGYNSQKPKLKKTEET